MYYKTLLLSLFLLFGARAFGQDTYSISGIVKDQKETLPGAGIYLSGYKVATVSNNDGKFIIPNLKPGSYDLIVQLIGYLPFKKTFTIVDKPVVVEVKLSENTTLLNEVVIQSDPTRNYYINLFKEFFIGKTTNAEKCRIVNTGVLTIDEDKRNRSVTIKATDFLIIENDALGYRIKYFLERFDYNFNTKILFFAGNPIFEEMKGSKSMQKRWEKNRQAAFIGSSVHFFKSLYAKKLDEEGFVVYKRYQMPNPDRLPDSLINANVKRLMTGSPAANPLTDMKWQKLTINDWLEKKKVPKILNVINRNKVGIDTLMKTVDNNTKVINFKDELFVINKNEREPTAYIGSSDYQGRPKDIGDFQVSVVKVFGGPIYFYQNGMIVDPNSTLYSGFWAYEKMADTMPLDYIPLPRK